MQCWPLAHLHPQVPSPFRNPSLRGGTAQWALPGSRVSFCPSSLQMCSAALQISVATSERGVGLVPGVGPPRGTAAWVTACGHHQGRGSREGDRYGPQDAGPRAPTPESASPRPGHHLATHSSSSRVLQKCIFSSMSSWSTAFLTVGQVYGL